jgi:hypothetical protein
LDTYDFNFVFRLEWALNNTVSWCQGPSLKFLDPHPNETVGLVSMPGSGNTWLRYLLQQSTGIMTGSLYNEENLMYNGFPGEGLFGGPMLVIKSHLWQLVF